MTAPQFNGVRAMASGIGQGRTDYTEEMFCADFPQFFTGCGAPLLPETILASFLEQASASIQPDRWLDGWRYACGLYVAHNAALYLRTYNAGEVDASNAAASAAPVGMVKRATLGDASVEYTTDPLTEATSGWGDLNATQYGQLLATRARLAGMGGCYVI